MLQTKKSPRVVAFMRECNQLMNIKGFRFVSQPNIPDVFFVNYAQNLPTTELNSLLKQVKAISSYTQSVSNMFIGHNMRRS